MLRDEHRYLLLKVNVMEKSPWMCHVCDYKSTDTESQACDLCFRVTCELHLRPASIYNEENGLYETARVCIVCGSSQERAD